MTPKQVLTMTQARDHFHLDKRFITDEIDVLERAGKTLVVLYSGSQMIVWTQTRLSWTREKYMHDVLVNRDVYQ